MNWILTNWFRTGLLLAILSGIFLAFGYLLGGNAGLYFAGIFALLMNFFSYWFSDKIVLMMHRAQEVDESSNPRLYRIVYELAQKAGLPMPRIYVIPDMAPNAFATGRSPRHSAVAVTQGLLEMMDDEELRGVLAHELSHIKNRDILIGSIAATIATAIMMLADMVKWAAIFGGFSRDDEDRGNIFVALAIAIITPIVATIIQLAISRSREYLADATAAKIVGHPWGLISALEKLGRYAGQIPPRYGSETVSHMYIVNPFSGKSLMKLFSTHPPIEDRIERLKQLAYKG